MKRLWAEIKSFWDRLQVGESAALVGLSEFGGHYMLPPDRRLDETQYMHLGAAGHNPKPLGGSREAMGGTPFRLGMFRDKPTTILAIDDMIDPERLEAIRIDWKIVFGVLPDSHHEDLARLADDGGRCA